MFSSGKIMPPPLQGLDDGEKFPIIDVIILFCWRESGRMIGVGMEISIGVLLHEHSPSGSEGSVRHDEEEFGSVWHLDYWGGEEHLFQFNECIVLFLSPQEGSPLLGQIVEWLSEHREVRDELLVKVTEPNEGSDCFYWLGEFPLLHCSEFGRVHMYFPVLDHQS